MSPSINIGVFDLSLFLVVVAVFKQYRGIGGCQIRSDKSTFLFVGFHRVALINISEFGVAPFEKFVAFLSSMEKSPRVKKLQADKRIILSRGQYVNTLTSRTCLEELHFPLPNYHLGKQLYHHVYLNFKHFESRSPRF